MRPPSKGEAISRAIAAWSSKPGRPRPCRTWCTADREGPATWEVQLRGDARELLAVYWVGPRKVSFTALGTDVAMGREWAALNPDQVDQAGGPAKVTSIPSTPHAPRISAPEAIQKAVLAWTWNLNRPTPRCALCTVKGERPGSFQIHLWGRSLAVLAVYQVDACSISLLEKETARARSLAWTLRREEEAS